MQTVEGTAGQLDFTVAVTGAGNRQVVPVLSMDQRVLTVQGAVDTSFANQYTVHLATSPNLEPGIYQGEVNVRLCSDEACSTEYVGGQQRFSYTITVNPADWATFTIRNPGTTNPLSDVAYGDGKFVAAGVGSLQVSSDGINWSSRNSGTSNNLYDIANGGGLFVAVGDKGTILTSPDGDTWTSRASGLPVSQFTGEVTPLWGVAFGNGQFVAVGIDTVITSPDGIAWTSRLSGTRESFHSIDFGGGLFVATVAGGSIMTSPDGITWTNRYSDQSVYLTSATYGGGQFVAVGLGGCILTSPDGLTWTSRTTDHSNDFYDVAYGRGQFMAVGGPDLPVFAFSSTPPLAPHYGIILTSSDGINWTTSLRTGTPPFVAAAYGNGHFVVVSSDGTILSD